MRYWLGRLYLRLLGWKLEGQKPPFKKYLILAAPHTSNWDVPLMLAMSYVYGVQICWIGKHTLFRGPLGPLIRFLGGVPVDRRARHNAVQQMVDELARRDEFCLAITPEGTRSRSEYWKSGFYYIALQAQVPIVLGLLDYKRKVGGLFEALHPTGDISADMNRIRAFTKAPRESTPTISGRFACEKRRPCRPNSDALYRSVAPREPARYDAIVMPRNDRSLLIALLLLVGGAPSRADSIDDHLAVIAKVGAQGDSSSQARTACDALSAAPAETLPRLLAAMDTDNPVAANWYRVAYEAIVERELSRTDPRLPVNALRDFVRDAKHSGRARRLALALCDRLDADFSKTLIPQLVDDAEFRSDAVEAALAAGASALDGGDSELARQQFHRAFDHARDSQQTLRAAARLTALGEQVNVAQQLGLITRWWLVGPFDAPGFSGFERAFPPEEIVDLKANYAGQGSETLKWKPHQEADPMDLVNLVQSLAAAKEAVGYAYAEVDAPQATAGQLRAGADDNCTVWLNGEKVLARSQWLNGHRLDRFVAPVQIRQGRNTVLVKICQGPQHKDPQVPNNWSLQLRFCDASGKGLPLRTVSPSAEDCQP